MLQFVEDKPLNNSCAGEAKEAGVGFERPRSVQRRESNMLEASAQP